MPDFLLEIGCEEIPARMIDAASQELRERVHTLLNRERLNAKDTMTYFDTPRRLAVLVPGILAAQADISEQITGPAVTVAFKDGQPTPAAHAFAKKSGMHISQLDRISTPKGDYLSARITKKGRAAREIISELLPKEIASLYWPKNMYWRKPSERFVRPARWVVAMLDDEVLLLEVFGIKAGNQSRGHRILADREVAIPHAGEPYVSALRDAKVLSRGEREQQIRKGLDDATRAIPGARWREDKNLLDTVVNLTEFPSAILGTFDPEFLALPEEVLVTVMRHHQKYFSVEDAEGKLAPQFVAVMNIESDPKGFVRRGNERVLRARFNDARFFWDTDQKKKLADRREDLSHVTFQAKLGTYLEKAGRMAALVKELGGDAHAVRAAELCKCDLTTELVKEFTELQGVVGGLYARVQGEPEPVWQAIYDHYKPESMDDSIPRNRMAQIVALADKLDTLRGCFLVDLA